jgi:AraC family transcriptional regulator
MKPVMPEYLDSAQLFASPLVTISDWRCRGTEPHFGSEEESSGYVLVFPRTGLYVERRAGNDRVVADPSRVLFFNAGDVYRVAHPVSGGDNCSAIRFNGKALLDFVRQNAPSTDKDTSIFHLPSVGSTNPMVLLLHRLRQNLLRRTKPDALEVEEDASSLLRQALGLQWAQHDRKHEPVRADTRKAHRDLVHAVHILLAKRFRDALSLSDIARAVFSSPFHLARIFRLETGTSLHAHQTQLRLRAALCEIADGARDLTALALELGFSSHAHFSFAFQRNFHASPSEIRKQLSSARLAKLSRNTKAARASLS